MSAVMRPVASYQDLLKRLRGTDLPGAGVPWIGALRAQASERFARLAFPGRSDEAWRYTSLEGLLKQDFAPAERFNALDARGIQDALIPDLRGWRLTFVNGFFAPQLSLLDELPNGVSMESLRGVLQRESRDLEPTLGRCETRTGNVFSAFNTAGFADGACIRIAPGVKLERSIQIVHLSRGAGRPQIGQPRNLILLGDDARASVIESHLSRDSGLYFNNAVLEIDLAPGAELHHVRIQNESEQAFHMNSQFLRQAAGSRYSYIGVSLGGAWVRNDTQVALEGEGANADLRGLYLVSDGQLSDHHLDVRHLVPECSSRESFRGVLNGRGRGVFDGRILVAKDAQKTDAHLSNANLLLSRQAEIDTKPQLEIYADDVKCSHGTTVGQIEDDQIFYLQSRGIPQHQARRMICLGFAREAFENSGSEALDRYLESAVADRLGAEVRG